MILQDSASRGGQGSSVVVLQLQSREARAGTKGTNLENPNSTLSSVEGKGSVEIEIRDCQDAVRS